MSSGFSHFNLAIRVFCIGLCCGFGGTVLTGSPSSAARPERGISRRVPFQRIAMTGSGRRPAQGVIGTAVRGYAPDPHSHALKLAGKPRTPGKLPAWSRQRGKLLSVNRARRVPASAAVVRAPLPTRQHRRTAAAMSRLPGRRHGGKVRRHRRYHRWGYRRSYSHSAGAYVTREWSTSRRVRPHASRRRHGRRHLSHRRPR
jgi:hypothetical protein